MGSYGANRGGPRVQRRDGEILVRQQFRSLDQNDCSYFCIVVRSKVKPPKVQVKPPPPKVLIVETEGQPSARSYQWLRVPARKLRGITAWLQAQEEVWTSVKDLAEALDAFLRK